MQPTDFFNHAALFLYVCIHAQETRCLSIYSGRCLNSYFAGEKVLACEQAFTTSREAEGFVVELFGNFTFYKIRGVRGLINVLNYSIGKEIEVRIAKYVEINLM